MKNEFQIEEQINIKKSQDDIQTKTRTDNPCDAEEKIGDYDEGIWDIAIDFSKPGDL